MFEMVKKTSFFELTQLFMAVEATMKRNEKKALLCNFLRTLNEDEVAPAILFLVGRPFPEGDTRVLNVRWKTVGTGLQGIDQPSLVTKPLTILGVKQYFNEISKVMGKGSRRKKENFLRSLFSQAKPLERKYLVRLLLGEMRIGVMEGIVLEAIADMASASLHLVRRSYMLLGSLGDVARIALQHGIKGLSQVGLHLFTPIKPMLAEMAYNLKDVFTKHGGLTGFEYKLDGARVQIHFKRNQVKIFSRRLKDVTESLPDIRNIVINQIKAKEALLDGEVVAYSINNKPLPFQELMKRFRRIHQINTIVKKIPLKLYLFDILYFNGKQLLDKSYNERWGILSTICEPYLLTTRIITDKISEAQAFLESALKNGHEGIIAKALNSSYTPGTRGKKWFKIKPVKTLDLAIIAADWGYGRRKGWLSNYHLGAFNEKTNEYLSVGKTFKGLTDEEFNVMTLRLKKIIIQETRYTVHVMPQIVVEVGFNEIQRSPHYKSGFALRFARILRIRDDKTPQSVDTIEKVKEMYEKQFEYKAKLETSNSKNF